MNTIHTANDYLKMKSSEKKRLVKQVLKRANEDQQAVIERYERAVAEKQISPIN